MDGYFLLVLPVEEMGAKFPSGDQMYSSQSHLAIKEILRNHSLVEAK